MAITLEQAKALKSGTTVYCKGEFNKDGTPRKFRINGAPRTWKKSPDRVYVPLKWGLKSYGHIDETNMESFFLSEEK